MKNLSRDISYPIPFPFRPLTNLGGTERGKSWRRGTAPRPKHTDAGETRFWNVQFVNIQYSITAIGRMQEGLQHFFHQAFCFNHFSLPHTCIFHAASLAFEHAHVPIVRTTAHHHRHSPQSALRLHGLAHLPIPSRAEHLTPCTMVQDF